jgi:hypothetical protein
MAPSGIEPATFRFVAQYLNHCATISGPQIIPRTVGKLHKYEDKLYEYASRKKNVSQLGSLEL